MEPEDEIELSKAPVPTWGHGRVYFAKTSLVVMEQEFGCPKYCTNNMFLCLCIQHATYSTQILIALHRFNWQDTISRLSIDYHIFLS